jgi:hypothetical protein
VSADDVPHGLAGDANTTRSRFASLLDRVAEVFGHTAELAEQHARVSAVEDEPFEEPNGNVRGTPAKLPNARAPTRVAFEARPPSRRGPTPQARTASSSSGATRCGGGPTVSRPRVEFVLGEGERLVHPQPGASEHHVVARTRKL